MWESTATLRLLGGARLGEERVGGILCRHAHSLVSNDSVVVQRRFNSILLSDSFSTKEDTKVLYNLVSEEMVDF